MPRLTQTRPQPTTPKLAGGSAHPKLATALTEVGIAAAKSDKVARLINEINEHIAAYVNLLAPGAASTGNAIDASPSGGRLIEEATSRRSRLARLHRTFTEVVAENEGDIKHVERITISTFKDIKRPEGAAQPGVGTPQAAVSDQTRGGQSQNPIADIVLAAAALALAGRAGYQGIKKFRERTKASGDQAGDN